MELETAFYIIGIIFMSLMLLLMLGLVIAVLVIRAKINAIHKQIDDKLHLIGTWAHTFQNIGTEVVQTAKKAKRTVTGH